MAALKRRVLLSVKLDLVPQMTTPIHPDPPPCLTFRQFCQCFKALALLTTRFPGLHKYNFAIINPNSKVVDLYYKGVLKCSIPSMDALFRCEVKRYKKDMTYTINKHLKTIQPQSRVPFAFVEYLIMRVKNPKRWAFGPLALGDLSEKQRLQLLGKHRQRHNRRVVNWGSKLPFLDFFKTLEELFPLDGLSGLISWDPKKMHWESKLLAFMFERYGKTLEGAKALVGMLRVPSDPLVRDQFRRLSPFMHLMLHHISSCESIYDSSGELDLKAIKRYLRYNRNDKYVIPESEGVNRILPFLRKLLVKNSPLKEGWDIGRFPKQFIAYHQVMYRKTLKEVQPGE